MAAITTDKVYLPRVLADGIISDIKDHSVVLNLSGAEPQLFGERDIIVFSQAPKAEYVGEGGVKGSSDAAFTSVTAKPHKVQVTVRVSNEFQWADEDHRVGYMAELVKALGASIREALDLGALHGINPKTGTKSALIDNYVGLTTNVVDAATGTADSQVTAAVGSLVAAEKDVNGIALSTVSAWDLAQTKKTDGDLLYPALGLGKFDTFKGIRTDISKNVAADGKTKAIVGDFANGLKVGLVRDIPVKVIQYGDPDNSGVDLQSVNMVALRAEAVFSWHAFTDRFAVVKAE